MDNFVIISGCSGGGKSTLLAQLKRRGHAVIEEPGRRVVQQQVRDQGQALPWLDLVGFLRRVMDMALADYRSAVQNTTQWVFFDRGVIDAAAALERLTGEPVLAAVAESCRYHRQVFLTPPWPEIYVQDAERRHDMQAAKEEFEQLQGVYPALGYQVSLLPRTAVDERADFLLERLAEN